MESPLDTSAAVAAIVYNLPAHPPVDDPNDPDGDGYAHAVQERENFAENLRTAFDGAEIDPLLGEIEAALERRARADRELRLLLAYGREFPRPRPYSLESLAQAAGMTPSGVKKAYTAEHILQVATATGLKPRGGGASA